VSAAAHGAAQPPWHPMIVHFPVALVVCAALLLLAARLRPGARRSPILSTVGTWNLCLGAVAALFALGSGLAAVLDLDVGPAARQAISLHVKWAIFTSLGLVLVAVWRGAGTAPDSRPSWLQIVMLSAVAAALLVTAYLGGRNVYDYAVGVR
jgi:uncharacterized membrane protein